MKKSIALVAMAFGVTSAFAQDLTSKKGEPFLPEAGDYAIGIDATPFLNYAGNFFGKGAANVAPTFDFHNTNYVITGKKFKDANNAYRASLRVGLSKYTSKAQVIDAGITSAPTYPALPSMKEDKGSFGSTNVALSAGVEKRRGKTRLQGVYGAEAALGLTSSSEKYTYGNALSTTVDVVNYATTDFGNNIVADTYGNAARITKNKAGAFFTIGARAFVGAEYFVAPKISIGGEFGWGLGLGIQGKSTTTIESTNGTSVGTQEITGDKFSAIVLDTDNTNTFFGPSASLRLNLHF
jgi:hypothetical protein